MCNLDLQQGVSELEPDPDRMGIDKLRTLLVSTAKESAFRKVIQATMVRDRQHGPVIELNRISAVRSKEKNKTNKDGEAVVGGIAAAGKTVFMQMVAKMHVLGMESLLLPHRVWKVKFVGEELSRSIWHAGSAS